MAEGTRSGSLTGESGTKNTPSGNESKTLLATSRLRRLLPTPPTPSSVTTRISPSKNSRDRIYFLHAAHEGSDTCGRLVGNRRLSGFSGSCGPGEVHEGPFLLRGYLKVFHQPLCDLR